jgi:glycosyltransferase involved in cell wall biosynthesis
VAAGKPIFGAMNGARFEVINESACGKCVYAGDSEGLSDIMIEYIKNKDKYTMMGTNAKQYFEKHFTEEQHFKVLEDMLIKMKHYS